MRLKKVMALMMATTMVASALVGCGGQQGGQGGQGTETKEEGKKEEKVIKVGMEVAYPPFEYFEEDQTTITGLDHDLAVAIGKELGYKVEFVNIEWDKIFTGLEEKQYDVIMSAITITDERKAKYDFSTPYIQNYQCLVALKSALVKPMDLTQLTGQTVGCLTESTSADYVNNFIKANAIVSTVKPYDVMLDAFTDLKNGLIGAVVCDSTLADQYCKDPTYEMTWKQQDNPEEFAVCFPKGSELVPEFNKAIETLKTNGELDKIITMYLGK